ncbi:MAG: restriction endonuclease [Kangiella sp.]|nr:MAG: restriction endonuclease [Kangiella sp.]
MKKSPYLGLNENDWKKKTEEIVQDHPIKIDELVEIIKSSWDSIFASTIGTQKLQLGKDIVLSPQFTGSILGTLISHEFSTRYPKAWRPEASKQDKDLVYIPDEELSCEIKTSSSASRIYGNRSYAQPQSGNARKSKDGFYIGVNFDKMTLAMNALSKLILTLQGDGDYLGAVDLLATKGIITEQLANDLALLEKANIPVDIVFEQGKEVLGL